jgi:hypothetical protein
MYYPFHSRMCSTIFWITQQHKLLETCGFDQSKEEIWTCACLLYYVRREVLWKLYLLLRYMQKNAWNWCAIWMKSWFGLWFKKTVLRSIVKDTMHFPIFFFFLAKYSAMMTKAQKLGKKSENSLFLVHLTGAP